MFLRVLTIAIIIVIRVQTWIIPQLRVFNCFRCLQETDDDAVIVTMTITMVMTINGDHDDSH
jgi:hypothetical protein